MVRNIMRDSISRLAGSMPSEIEAVPEYSVGYKPRLGPLDDIYGHRIVTTLE
jgi:hypothetical protein